MKKNPVRATLEAGKPSIGAWLNLVSPMACEVMAAAGYEWLALDTEHSAFDLESIAHCFRAIEAHGAIPMARAWNDDPVTLARLLDAGSWGIVVPHVKTPGQAERIARAMRYPPRGTRSAGTGRIAALPSDYYQRFDDEVLVIPQIEDVEGIENVGEIARVEGVDVGFIGPRDLAFSMGVEPGHPDHEAAIQKVLEAFKSAGKPCGLPCREPEAIQKRIQEGFLFFDAASDLRLLDVGARKVVEEVRSF